MAETPDLDSPEVTATVAAEREKLLDAGPKLFELLRSQSDCLDTLHCGLCELQAVFASAAARGALSGTEMRRFHIAMAVTTALIETMQHNPLYDTGALTDQLLHHFARVVKGARVVAVTPKEPKNGNA